MSKGVTINKIQIRYDKEVSQRDTFSMQQKQALSELKDLAL